MNEVKLENARLKLLLQQIEKDYTSLQTRFFNICQPDLKKSGSPTCTHENIADEEESELVSLRLGRSPSPSESKKVDKKRSYDKTIEDYPSCDDQSNDGLKLGLDYSTRISEPDLIKPSNDPTPGPTSEVVKTVKRCDDESVKKDAGDDEVSQPNVKRARVSVRTKCDYPTVSTKIQLTLRIVCHIIGVSSILTVTFPFSCVIRSLYFDLKYKFLDSCPSFCLVASLL